MIMNTVSEWNYIMTKENLASHIGRFGQQHMVVNPSRNLMKILSQALVEVQLFRLLSEFKLVDERVSNPGQGHGKMW